MNLENNICRICLKKSSSLHHIFTEDLPHKIEMIASIHVSAGDNLPTSICDGCARNVHLLYDFRSIIIKSNVILTQQLAEYKANLNKIPKINIDIYSIKKSEPDDDVLEPIDSDVQSDVDLAESTPEYDFVYPIDPAKSEDQKPRYVKAKTREYGCKTCNFTTNFYGIWRSHRRKHVKCPNAICKTCGKSVRADNLKKHELIHTESPVACNVCGKYVKNTESLRGHMLIHKNIKFQCTICGKIYSHRGGYTAHVRRHELGDVKTIGCSLCGKLFYDKCTLMKHTRSHTGERPYPCQYCKKGFSSSHALKTHIRRHTKEKPYSCEYCPMAYPQRVSLRTHMKSKHPDKINMQAVYNS